MVENSVKNIKIGDVYRGLVSNTLMKVVDIRLEKFTWYITIVDKRNNERWSTNYDHFTHLLIEKVEDCLW